MESAGIIIISELQNNRYKKVKKVIRTSNFTHPLGYDKYGYISKFRINSDSYYVKTILNTENGIKITYYNETDYNEYKAGVKALKEVRVFNENLFILANNGDEIFIYNRVINLITSPFPYCYKGITWIYDGTIDSSDKIIIPENHTEVSTNCSILSPQADNFFQYYSNKLKDGNLEIDSSIYDETHELIADIASYLNSIEKDIYTKYQEDPNLQITFNPPLTILIQNQLSELSTTLNLENYTDFSNHYIKVSEYYKNFLNDLTVLLTKGTDLDKIVELLVSLSPQILIPISVKDKLKILSYLVSKKLETSLEEGFRRALSILVGPVINLIKNQKEIDKYENLAVKICQAFDENSLNDYDPNIPGISHIDIFLEGLTLPYKDNSVTLYEALYIRMSSSWNATEMLISFTNWVFNTGYNPKNTKGAFVYAIYALWEFSKFNPYDQNGYIRQGVMGFNILDSNIIDFDNVNDENNQNTIYKYTSEIAYESYTHVDTNFFGQEFENTLYRVERGNAAPLTMPYESNKSIGIYFDNFEFEFENKKIIANQKGLPTFTRYDSEMNSFDTYSDPILYGSYHMFQPVSLINVNLDTKVPILTTTNNPDDFGNMNLKVNSLMPIFVLHYIDSAGDRSDAETMLGFAVDAALTFSGIGNLGKLRHLRWVALGANEVSFFTRQGLRIFWSGIEFSTGVLGFFANFVECNTGDEFCKRMKEFIFLFEVAVGGISAGDTIATLAMRKKAKQVVDLAGGTTPEDIRNNLKNRFQQLHPTENPVVLQQSADAVFYTSLVPIPPAIIKRTINKITGYVTKRKNLGGKRLWDLDPSYTDSFLESYIQICKNQLNLTDDFILDYVYFANRKYYIDGQWVKYHQNKTKFIEPEQLIKRTYFHKLEIVKRGFGGGFNNISQYKQYCNSTKNQFINNLEIMSSGNYDADFLQYVSSLECSVKGSSATVLRVGDPPPIHHTTDLPTGWADDIDNKFGLSQSDFFGFLEELGSYVEANHFNISNRNYKEIMNKISDAKNTGAIGYETLKLVPVGNSNFTSLMRQAMKPHTQFPDKKINFFIMVNRTGGAENVKKISQYDNLPELPYSY